MPPRPFVSLETSPRPLAGRLFAAVRLASFGEVLVRSAPIGPLEVMLKPRPYRLSMPSLAAMRELSLDLCPLLPGFELLFAKDDLEGRTLQRRGFARLCVPVKWRWDAAGSPRLACDSRSFCRMGPFGGAFGSRSSGALGPASRAVESHNFVRSCSQYPDQSKGGPREHGAHEARRICKMMTVADAAIVLSHTWLAYHQGGATIHRGHSMSRPLTQSA